MIIKNKLLTIIIPVIVVLAVVVAVATASRQAADVQMNSSATTLHSAIREDFSGNTLSQKWEIVRNWNGTINVSDGTLNLSEGTHKRINSSFTTTTENSTVLVTGKLLFSAYYQKFGVNINGENASNDIGVYFDTFCPQNVYCRHDNSTLLSGNNPIYMFVKENSADIYEGKAEITKGQFHLLQIAISPNDITFLIDEHQVGNTKYRFSGPITIGIWSDRPSEMRVDWITVSSE